jgi:hypothetical protein
MSKGWGLPTVWFFSDIFIIGAGISSFLSQCTDSKKGGQERNSLAEILPHYDFFIWNAEVL